MREKLYISPSTDPIDSKQDNFNKKIVDYAKEMLESGADFLHCDIMDGEFVENETYSYDTVKLINENCLIPLDVHLMIEQPELYIYDYHIAGTNFLTLHYEIFDNDEKLIASLKFIRTKKMLAGVSVKPSTPIEKILNILKYCDIVLVMSVEPGKSGQTFLEDAYIKVLELAKIREQQNMKFLIEVDGGINPDISQKLKKCGADIIVSGSYIFKSKNKKEAINLLK